MSFTVKVIFLGLIGFVPNSQGGEDVAALLVDPVRAQPRCTSCSALPHTSVVLLLHGECKGDCYRIEDTAESSQERNLRRGGWLFWILDKERLDISGDDDDEFKVRDPNFFLRLFQGATPGGARQSSYFSWVPDMEKLTSGHGQLRYECLSDDPRCPLHARFPFQGGEVATCHMFHGDDESGGDKRNVRIFNYVTSDGKHFRRAVADAEQITFQEHREKVVLRSYRNQQLYREADLRPNGEGRVTLIVANVPSRATHSHEIYSRAHSEVFFHLLKEPGPRSVRILDERRRRVDPGPCEEDLRILKNLLTPQSDVSPWGPLESVGGVRGELREVLLSLYNAIHAATACDGIRFPKP